MSFGIEDNPPFPMDSYTLTPISLFQGFATVGGYLSFFGIAITLTKFLHKKLFYRQLKKKAIDTHKKGDSSSKSQKT